MSVGDLASNREDKPPYVTFHRVPVEMPAESEKAGHVVFKDVDYVHITPAYTKDVIKHRVKDWFAQLLVNAQAGRFNPMWIERYKEQYAAWQNGQELPVDGMPIRGWSVISPAQQETLCKMNIRTVEDAARMNADAVRMIGMGAMDIKNRAIAALQAARDTGPLVMENAALKERLSVAEKNVEDLTNALTELTAIVKGASAAQQYASAPQESEIAASDILSDDPPKRGPGRPRKAEATV